MANRNQTATPKNKRFAFMQKYDHFFQVDNHSGGRYCPSWHDTIPDTLPLKPGANLKSISITGMTVDDDVITPLCPLNPVCPLINDDLPTQDPETTAARNFFPLIISNKVESCPSSDGNSSRRGSLYLSLSKKTFHQKYESYLDSYGLETHRQ